MREYGKVSPRIWTGRLGRSLRGDQPAQIVALYLVTCQHMNLLGLYLLPLSYISADTGLSGKAVSDAMSRLKAADYCRYDEASERVWIVQHLRHEMGDTGYREGDNRWKAIAKHLAEHSISSLSQDLWIMYKLLERGLEAPSKPLESPSEGASNTGAGASTGTLTGAPNGRRGPSPGCLAAFEVWKLTLPETSRSRTILNEKRQKAYEMRVAEGHSQDQIEAALRGWKNDPWKDRPQQNDMALLLRDGGQVEKFAALAALPKPPLSIANRPQHRAAGYNPESEDGIAALDAVPGFDPAASQQGAA